MSAIAVAVAVVLRWRADAVRVALVLVLRWRADAVRVLTRRTVAYRGIDLIYIFKYHHFIVVYSKRGLWIEPG